MQVMKFFCHLKVVDRNLARITFIVMHVSYSTFHVSAIQSATTTDADYISPLSLYKNGDDWSYQSEIAAKQISGYLLSEVVDALEKKLDIINQRKEYR